MPSWIADLVRLEDDPAGYRATATMGSDGRLFGGLIAAQSLAAAGATVEPDRQPQSLHAYFIKGGRTGVDVVYTVERTRDGRSFDTRQVTARQDGVPILEMLASFHRPEATLDWQQPHEAGPALAEADTEIRPPEDWTRFLEYRTAGGDPDGWPHHPYWFRSREPIEDDPLLRACALTYVSDLGMVDVARPPGQFRPGPGGAATLDHSLWLHRPLDPHQWHRYDATGVSHSDARGMAFGSIRDESGRLVASAAQESLWRI